MLLELRIGPSIVVHPVLREGVSRTHRSRSSSVGIVIGDPLPRCGVDKRLRLYASDCRTEHGDKLPEAIGKHHRYGRGVGQSLNEMTDQCSAMGIESWFWDLQAKPLVVESDAATTEQRNRLWNRVAELGYAIGPAH